MSNQQRLALVIALQWVTWGVLGYVAAGLFASVIRTGALAGSQFMALIYIGGCLLLLRMLRNAAKKLR